MASDPSVAGTITVGAGTVLTDDSTVLVGSSAELQHLSPYTSYSVVVSAATRVGEGVASRPVVCTTLEDGENNKYNRRTVNNAIPIREY